MTRLPHRLDLGLALINIKLLTRKEMRVEAECEEDEATPEGMWSDEHDTIYLGRWLSQKRKREVLFHELVHAMIDLREHVGGAHES